MYNRSKVMKIDEKLKKEILFEKFEQLPDEIINIILIFMTGSSVRLNEVYKIIYPLISTSKALRQIILHTNYVSDVFRQCVVRETQLSELPDSTPSKNADFIELSHKITTIIINGRRPIKKIVASFPNIQRLKFVCDKFLLNNDMSDDEEDLYDETVYTDVLLDYDVLKDIEMFKELEELKISTGMIQDYSTKQNVFCITPPMINNVLTIFDIDKPKLSKIAFESPYTFSHAKPQIAKLLCHLTKFKVTDNSTNIINEVFDIMNTIENSHLNTLEFTRCFHIKDSKWDIKLNNKHIFKKLKHLIINEASINDEALKQLSGVIAGMYLLTLDLSNNEITDVKPLDGVFTGNTLRMHHNKICEFGSIFNLINNNIMLETLDISSNDLNLNAKQDLPNVDTINGSKLETLNISRNNIGVSGLRLLSTLLRGRYKLKVLDITSTKIKIDETNNELFETKLSNETNNKLFKQFVTRLSTQHPLLHTLHIGHNKILSDGFNILADFLSKPNSLIVLNVQYNDIRDYDNLNVLNNPNCKLRMLNLAGNCNPRRITNVISYLCNLVMVDLSNMQLENNKIIDKIIESNNCRLHRVILVGNYVTSGNDFIYKNGITFHVARRPVTYHPRLPLYSPSTVF